MFQATLLEAQDRKRTQRERSADIKAQSTTLISIVVGSYDQRSLARSGVANTVVFMKLGNGSEQINHWNGSEQFNAALELFNAFQKEVITPFSEYQLPVITLSKSSRREAVCQVFEKVNTGGVSLNAFELVTASYAADGYDLRADWFDGEPETEKRLSKAAHSAFDLDVKKGKSEGNQRLARILKAVRETDCSALLCSQREQNASMIGKHRFCPKISGLELVANAQQSWISLSRNISSGQIGPKKVFFEPGVSSSNKAFTDPRISLMSPRWFPWQQSLRALELTLMLQPPATR